MILRIDHVALAVKDYEKAFDFFTTLFNALPGACADDASMGYLWQTMALGDLSRLELITPTGGESFLDGFLNTRQGGVHHITMQTPDIYRAKEILDAKGIPHFGFKDYGPFWKELFIHPRDAFGVLIQIAQFDPDDWLPAQVKMPAGRKWSVEKGGPGLTLSMKHPGGGTVKFELTRDEATGLMEDLRKAL